MAAITAGTMNDYTNASLAWDLFFRKLGLGPRTMVAKSPSKYNSAPETTTNTTTSSSLPTIARRIAICVRATSPATNTTGDAPTGAGDIAVVVAGSSPAGRFPQPGSLTLWRCTGYTSSTVFTWAQIA